MYLWLDVNSRYNLFHGQLDLLEVDSYLVHEVPAQILIKQLDWSMGTLAGILGTGKI